MTTWRLVPLLQAPGDVQMAIDRWLFQQHLLKQHPPALRFYTWSPIAISLGYHQHRYPEAWKQLIWKNKSVDLVRRPTGGRAVLHQGDLTYAVVTSGIPGNRMQAYQAICEFLIAGWRSLDVALQYGQAGRGYIQNPNCFGTATAADLVLDNGTKLIGSAQFRRGDTVLQHGSIRLEPDPRLFAQVFGSEDRFELPEPLFRLPRETLLQQVMDALTASAQACFGINLVVEPLTPEEFQQILAND